MVRIISGTLRGNKLANFTGNDVRPTSDRIKEWIFNVLGDIEGSKVLDLFAGTGNLGIEAISRGAESVTFVDRSSKSLQLIKKNVTLMKLENSVEIQRKDSLKFIGKKNKGEFDLIFADPPYSYSDSSRLTLGVINILPQSGTFVYETSMKVSQNLPIEPGRVKKFGETVINIYRGEN